jgi:hypothetical protein
MKTVEELEDKLHGGERAIGAGMDPQRMNPYPSSTPVQTVTTLHAGMWQRSTWVKKRGTAFRKTTCPPPVFRMSGDLLPRPLAVGEC